MNRRIIAVILVIIVASVGFYLILFPIGTSFHYQKRGEADNEGYLIGFHNIMDCEISLSFTNDSTLLYSVDIEMYGFVSSTVFYIFQDENTFLLNYYSGPNRAEWTADDVRVKKLDVVLGTGKAYDIGITGTNLNATASYENGALIGQDTYFSFKTINGSIDFSYDGYDVDSTTLEESGSPTRIDVYLGYQSFINPDLDYVNLDVNLPYFYYGDADFIASFLDITASGWTLSPFVDSYFTDAVEGFPPNFYTDVFSDEIVANLAKATEAT